MDARPADRPRDQPARLAIGVLAPLAVLVLSYALWSISDRVGYIGPLDKASFGWSVVIPVWIAAPIVAGFAWRDLSKRQSLGASIIVGGAVAVTGTALLWRAIAFPDCETGDLYAPLDWVPPSALVGLVAGLGPAVTGLFVAGLLRRGRRWRAILAGASLGLFLVFVAGVVAGMTLELMPACQRP